MSAFEWHPRHHKAALDGMRGLTLEERGAYNTMLDLIYDRGGPMPDDDRLLAGWMGCSTRRWNIIKAALIAKGKLTVKDTPKGRVLSNRRCEEEIVSQEIRARKLRENGAKGGRKPRETKQEANEIKPDALALGSAPLKLKTETETLQCSDTNVSGGEPPGVVPFDPDQRAWSDAVSALSSVMSEAQARAFFGKLLATNKLLARDMAGAVATALANRTQDPAAYLTKSAASITTRRSAGALGRGNASFT